MPVFEIETPEGKILEIEAPDEATALQGAQEWSAGQTGGNASGGAASSGFVTPEPPPGVMIHGSEGSYIAGQTGLSVDTRGMSQEDRDMASAALAGRRDAPMSRGLMPTMQGVSMSWGDEAVSGAYGLAAAAQGQDPVTAYNYAQEAQRQELEQERKENPIRSAATQIGGALLWAPRAVTAAAPLASAPLGGKVVAGSLTGLGYGALDGAGAGSGLADRGTGAAVGGAVGAGVGALAPALGSAIGNGVNKFLDWRDVSRNLKALGVDRPAGDVAMRALDADGALNGSGAARLAQAGDGAMLADAGPATRAVLDTAMRSGGPAMRVGGEAVQGRAAAANDRLTNVLDAVLGKPEGIATRADNVRTSTAPARKATYDAAYAAPIDYSAPEARQLEELLKRVPRKALEEANDLMGLVGRQSQQILADIADDGSITYRQMPDVFQIDNITLGLRQLAESSEGTGALGQQTRKGAAYERLAGDIRNLARKLVPEYGKALDTAADPIQEIKSLKFGRDLLRPNIARDEVAMRVKDMTAAELRGVRQGLRSQIDETVANVQAVASDPNLDAREATKVLRDLSSRAAREKVKVVLGNDTATAVLFKELDEATKALELRAGVASNSATFGRNVIDEAVKAAQEPGLVGNLQRGQPLKATQTGVQTFFGTRPQDMVAERDEIYRQIAELLTTPKSAKREDALKRLYQAYQALPKNAATANQAGDAASAALGLGLIPSAAEGGRSFLGVSSESLRRRQ